MSKSGARSTTAASSGVPSDPHANRRRPARSAEGPRAGRRSGAGSGRGSRAPRPSPGRRAHPARRAGPARGSPRRRVVACPGRASTPAAAPSPTPTPPRAWGCRRRGAGRPASGSTRVVVVRLVTGDDVDAEPDHVREQVAHGPLRTRGDPDRRPLRRQRRPARSPAPGPASTRRSRPYQAANHPGPRRSDRVSTLRRAHRSFPVAWSGTDRADRPAGCAVGAAPRARRAGLGARRRRAGRLGRRPGSS